MGHGISVRNTAGHILISSDITTLHCAGAATIDPSQSGTGVTTYESYTGTTPYSTLEGRTLYTYYIESTAAPLFFIKPTGDYNKFHGILRQWQVGGRWYVTVIKGGGDPDLTPLVLAFVPPVSATPNSETVGVVTYLPDGSVAFDSRKRPLAVMAALVGMPPQYPMTTTMLPNLETSGHDFGDAYIDYPMNPVNYNSVGRSASVPAEHVMYTTPCLAQCVYDRVKRGFKSSSGYFGSQDHHSTAQWWVMYHQGIRITSSTVDIGWCIYRAGFRYSAAWESGGWIGGGGGSTGSGEAPYARETINLTDSPIILADSRPYL